MTELSKKTMRFSNSIVLVTGAAGGLGSAIAHAFADQGGCLIITDTNQERGQQLAREIGRGAEYMTLDVSNEANWLVVLDSIELMFGRIDIVINNAGFFKPNIAFEKMPLSLWKKHFSINSDGVFLGCKHGILRLKKSGGAIVNIASGMSLKVQSTASAYCASKAAVLMTTRAAAVAAGRYNIRVNAVLPGPVETPMLMTNLAQDQQQTELLVQLAGHSPLGRLATSEDIARAVLFLADPTNSAITGVYLPVDGGNLTYSA